MFASAAAVADVDADATRLGIGWQAVSALASEYFRRVEQKRKYKPTQ